MTMKAKSIDYCQKKNWIKNRLKTEISRQISDYENSELYDDEQYIYLKERLREIENKEIEGYIRRVKYDVQYEKGEPDIAFFSKVEKKKITSNRINQLAEEENGEIYTNKGDILRIATKFYRELYTPKKLNLRKQNILLGNITKQLGLEDREKLNAPITEEQVKIAIFQLLVGKSPGLDGIPIEFYREFWEDIKDLYMAHINKVQTDGLLISQNASVIK